MMTDKQLPTTITSLVAAMERTAQAIGHDEEGTGLSFLRLTKGGEWEYGADSMEVENESHWAINFHSFEVGFQAWNDDGTLAGEERREITEEPLLKQDMAEIIDPDTNEPVEWKKLYAFRLVCIDGEDMGTELEYKTTSKGGIKAVRKLLTSLANRSRNPEADGKYVPVVVLQSDSYQHKVKKYGTIYTPVFKIVKWLPDAPEANPTGATPVATAEPAAKQAEPEPEPVAAAEPETATAEPADPAPARRRRRATGPV